MKKIDKIRFIKLANKNVSFNQVNILILIYLMEQNIKSNNKIIFYLIFICLLYPLFHGLSVYTIVYTTKIIFNFENPYFNLLLLGLKEIALLLLFLFLFIKNHRSYYLILIIFFFSIVFGPILFLKDIFIPFLLLYFVFNNIDIIYKKVIEKKKLIKNLILFIIFISIIISVWDLIYRITHNINPSSFLETNYLVIFNKIKCSKAAFTSSLKYYNECIYGGYPNFYKIFTDGQYYVAKNVLFMPTGDSVTLSYVFLHMILILIFIKNSKFFNKKYVDFFLLCLVIVQIFTFNRLNILFSLIIFFYYFYKNKNLLITIPVILLFFYYFENIFLSIFDSRVPSNIGHAESYQRLISGSKYNYLQDITIFNVLVAVLIFLSIIFFLIKIKIKKKTLFIVITIFTIFFIFVLNIPLTIFGTTGPVPTESNYLKIIYSYGLIGIAFYIYILTIIAYNLNEKNFYVKVLSLNILLSQFISPYVISGFVVFMPAVLLMALFKDQNE